MSFFSKIAGTFENFFQIGKKGPRVKNNSGALEARDFADAVYANMRGADPLIDDDLITLRHFNSFNDSATSQTTVLMPLALATKVSSVPLPNNARIIDAFLDVTTPYDVGTLWAITRTGDGSVVLLAAGDSDPEVANIYQVPQQTDWGSTGAGTVSATITGTPGAGVAALFITYVTPNDIS